MNTVVKHKKTGNQSPAQAVEFDVNAVIKETALQLGNYATAQQLSDNAKAEKKTAKDMLDKLMKQYKKHNVSLGDLPKTDSENAYKNLVIKQESVKHTVAMYQAMPESLGHDTKRNYISAFRVCLRDNLAFNHNPSRARTKGAKDSTKELVKGKDVAQKMPKTADQKHGAVKQSLADVIRANFKTLLSNNPQLAQELAEELAELAGV